MLDGASLERYAGSAPKFELTRRADLGADAAGALEGEIAAAAAALTDPDVPRLKAVHAARRHVKRARTLLRLLRHALGPKRAEAANAALREGARALSGRRDADVLEALARGLAEGAAGPARTALWDVAERAAGSGTAGSAEAELDQALASLRKARDLVAGAEMPGKAPRLMAEELVRLYRRGRKDMRAAAESQDDEALHDWRKRVKDRWHAARLLGPVWPKGSRPRTRKLDRLGEMLGHDHDLAVLAQALEGRRGELDPAAVEAALALTRGRQKANRRRLFELGEGLYREEPKAFARAWKGWGGA